MQLTYRGLTYTPSYRMIETSELPITGTYRGQNVSFSAPQPQQAGTEELVYRGVAYRLGTPRPGERLLNSRLTLLINRGRFSRVPHPVFRSH